MARRLSDREYQDLMVNPRVREAMRLRCEEERHEYVGAMTVLFQVYQECKWCGARR